MSRPLHPCPFPDGSGPTVLVAGSGGSVRAEAAGHGAPGTLPGRGHRLPRLLFPANAGAGAELGRKLAIKR